jgi:hypothetical protein
MTIEDAFSLTFQVAITDATGSRLTFDLKRNGEKISVTNDNREVIEKTFFSEFIFDFLGICTSL